MFRKFLSPTNLKNREWINNAFIHRFINNKNAVAVEYLNSTNDKGYESMAEVKQSESEKSKIQDILKQLQCFSNDAPDATECVVFDEMICADVLLQTLKHVDLKYLLAKIRAPNENLAQGHVEGIFSISPKELADIVQRNLSLPLSNEMYSVRVKILPPQVALEGDTTLEVEFDAKSRVPSDLILQVQQRGKRICFETTNVPDEEDDDVEDLP